LQDAIINNDCNNEDLRLFVGYSGWAPGQLDAELQQGSWIVADVSEDVVFEASSAEAWKHAVRLLGKKYAFMENLPINPSLN
jgi:putative transcriptional regulator